MLSKNPSPHSQQHRTTTKSFAARSSRLQVPTSLMDTARLTPHACPLKQRDSNKDGQPKEVAQSLVEHLDSEHLTRWHETVKSTDFTYSSHKAWNLLCWLDVTQTTTQVRPDVSPENIASLLLETAKMPIPKKQRREVKWEHICNLKTWRQPPFIGLHKIWNRHHTVGNKEPESCWTG